MRADQEHWSSAPFLTSSRGNPPPLTSTNFTVQDDGEWAWQLVGVVKRSES